MQDWTDAMEETISQDELQFVRSCSPPNAVKKPRIVDFWDGSLSAFAGVLYVVTMVTKNIKVEFDALPDGDAEDRYLNPKIHEFKSNILTTKARVTPLKGGITIP